MPPIRSVARKSLPDARAVHPKSGSNFVPSLYLFQDMQDSNRLNNLTQPHTTVHLSNQGSTAGPTMPSAILRKGLQASLVLTLLLAAAAPASVEARRRQRKQQQLETTDAPAEDRKATEQYDELPPSSPPLWKGKIGASRLVDCDVSSAAHRSRVGNHVCCFVPNHLPSFRRDSTSQ